MTEENKMENKDQNMSDQPHQAANSMPEAPGEAPKGEETGPEAPAETPNNSTAVPASEAENNTADDAPAEAGDPPATPTDEGEAPKGEETGPEAPAETPAE